MRNLFNRTNGLQKGVGTLPKLCSPYAHRTGAGGNRNRAPHRRTPIGSGFDTGYNRGPMTVKLKTTAPAGDTGASVHTTFLSENGARIAAHHRHIRHGVGLSCQRVPFYRPDAAAERAAQWNNTGDV